MSGRKLKNNMKLIDDNRILTVETVLEGHPDKVCDQISDAILDEYLKYDRKSNVAIECLGTGNMLYIGGEVFSNAKVNIDTIANNVYRNIGYINRLDIIENINNQSKQLRLSIDNNAAGDQGIMYGYACNSKYNYLPYSIYVINMIAKEIDSLRKRENKYLPDGKVQITFNRNKIDTLVINIQHKKEVDIEELRNFILNKAINSVIPIGEIRKIYFNNNSKFISGGFENDTGLTGRKIICDTYCGLVSHGGGSFSGKDPSKVDRSAAYMARFVAKNLVANEVCKECKVSVAYVFGEEKPIMLDVKTDSIKSSKVAKKIVSQQFDFRPKAIIERLSLDTFRYRQTATYGHFTNPQYPWENIIGL